MKIGLALILPGMMVTLFQFASAQQGFGINNTWGSSPGSDQDLVARASSIAEHFNQGTFSTFTGASGVTLSAYANEVPDELGAIVLVSGRSESFMKYSELISDLNDRGYSVYSYDHRGQGMSGGRLAADPQKGYIDRFDNYVEDMDLFVRQIVQKKPHANLYMIAHSMGGLIATQYLERGHSPFQAVMLNSPAVALISGHWDITVEAVTCLVSSPTDYTMGQGPDGLAPDFDKSALTHSPIRYLYSWQRMHTDPRELTGHQELPAIAYIGGATNRWVCDTVRGGEKARLFAHKVGSTPVLIEGADEDTLVRVNEEEEMCGRIPDCTFHMNHGRHELLFEVDQVRDQVFNETLDFFASHANGGPVQR